jgi:hypothetical protein
MRKYEYLCDWCKRAFGDQLHINVKNGDIRISFMSKNGHWSQDRVPIKCSEYHFCNSECLNNWMNERIEKAIINTEEKIINKESKNEEKIKESV